MALPLITSPRFNNTLEGFNRADVNFTADLASNMTISGQCITPSVRQHKMALRSARNSVPNRDFISATEFVQTARGKPQSFGFKFYEAPSNEMLLKTPNLGYVEKSKNTCFVDRASKQMSWVPGPIYNREIDWSKQLKATNGRFLKSPRYSIAGEIERLSKIKEKSVVGPNHYKEDEQWHKEGKKRKVSVGNFLWKDKRHSYIENSANQQIKNPSPDKYNKIKLDVVRDRVMDYKIHKSNFPRFSPSI